MKTLKQTNWHPGIYENRTAQEVQAVVGTNVPKTPFQSQTPRSMRAIKLKELALRKDGRLCKPLNAV